MKKLTLLILIVLSSSLFGQSINKKVLFIGNSYTNVNDLPQMVSDVAISTGDSLYVDSNTPGGYTFQGHATNTTTLSKIASGNWDYVVLQEQSQRPAFPINQVNIQVMPFAHILDSIINAENNCVETIFYMTWGRKNGDVANCPIWPPVCTYTGMDSLLNLRYKMMADSNSAIISPVGAVWKYLRNNYPQIELYQSDDSHPTVAGTYAAACCFYATIFKKNPTFISFNSTLSQTDADIIKNAAKIIVFDSLLDWNIGKYNPSSNFDVNYLSPNQVAFSNNSLYANSYFWDFGDGTTSTTSSPNHTYQSNGSYNVSLITEKCGYYDTLLKTINISQLSVNFESESIELKIFPNPIETVLTINQKKSANYTYKVSNISGQVITIGEIKGPITHIDFSNFNDGLYFLQLIENNKSKFVHKLIKNTVN